jgi:hypothetical protein
MASKAESKELEYGQRQDNDWAPSPSVDDEGTDAIGYI